MQEREGLTTKEQIDKMYSELEKAEIASINNAGGRRWGKIVKKVIKNASFCLAIVLLLTILINILIAKRRGEIPDVLGFYVFSIESASMEPTLMVGDLILCRKVSNPTNLPIGTIVTFKNTDGQIITHRIVGFSTDQLGKKGYITQGDNIINAPDKEVLDPERIIAVFIIKFRTPFTNQQEE